MITLDTLKEWDEKVKLGKGNEISEVFLKSSFSDIYEKHYYYYANIGRRIGLYSRVLSQFRSYFFSLDGDHQNNEAFISEYAVLLSDVGAIDISKRLLLQFENPSYSKTYFYRALLYMREWDYHRALGEIRYFLKVEESKYWQIIGRLNLVSCLLLTYNLLEASEEISNLEKENPNRAMSKGVLLEQKGELHFFKGEWELSTRCFSESMKILEKTNSPSFYFSKKWSFILKLQRGAFEEIKKDWDTFYREADEKGYWEVKREMQRYLAVQLNDENSLNKIFHGSNLPAYREMMLNTLRWSPASEYFTETPNDSSFVFDRQKMILLKDDKEIEISLLFRKLLNCLSEDLFKSFGTGYIFEKIYPDEYFSPEFGKQRIHSLISRFRRFCEAENLPLRINSKKFGFELQPNEDFSIKFSLDTKTELWNGDYAVALKKIKDKFHTSHFTAQNVAEFLDVSKRTANRILSMAVDSNEIQKTGQSRSTKFSVVDSKLP